MLIAELPGRVTKDGSLRGRRRCPASTMTQVQVTGDDIETIANDLTMLALSCVQAAAKRDSRWADRAVRRSRLQWSMESAVRAAEHERRAEPDEGRRLAAAAALKLIENAWTDDAGGVGIARIFNEHPNRLPVASGVCAHHGLVVLTACLLAEEVAQKHSPPSSPWVERHLLPARVHLCDVLAISAANLEKGSTVGAVVGDVV